MAGDLLSVDDALRRLLADLRPLPSEGVALEQACGRTLAEPVVSDIPLPPFTNSAVDGYAARADDAAAAAQDCPIVLAVVGEIPAGRMAERPVAAGQAMRITTGAPLPPGADCVVMVEDTDDAVPMILGALPAQVAVRKAVRQAANVRLAGEDVAAGVEVLASGRRLRPADIALLAAVGWARVPVHRRARVAIVSTGDELVPVEEPLTPGRIHDANGYALPAAIEAAGGQAVRLAISPDEIDGIVRGLDQAVESGADMILATAGVSVGAHDYVRQAVCRHGSLAFWRVNMRPGKPLAVGSYRGRPFMGLPGNPVSALVSFEVFVRPALARLQGEKGPDRNRLQVRLQEEVRSDGRETYLRAQVAWAEQEYHARLAGGQGSGMLSTLTAANALVIVPAGPRQVSLGTMLEAWLL